MKTTRRGLGGLLAGAVAATQTEVKNVGFGEIGKLSANNYPNTPIPISPKKRFKYLLTQRRRSYIDHYPRRDKHGETPESDVDVRALKSCSPAGRDVIFRTRRAKHHHLSHKGWIEDEMVQLLEQNPFLRAFI